MKHFFSESVLSLLIIGLLIVLTNPFEFLMPEEFMMLCTGLVIIFFILFALYLFRERAADEREELHRYIAARWAYLSGALVLVIGIVIQTFMHHLTFWLPLALGSMLVARNISQWYAKKYR